MQEFVVDIPRDEWWTQNRRGHWRVKFAHTSAVKQRAMAFARFWLQNGHHRPQHFPVHVTAIIHPLTHGRFDPENAAPMVKAILDALTDTGVWPDDDSKHIIGPDYRCGEPSIRKGWYRITIRIENAMRGCPTKTVRESPTGVKTIGRTRNERVPTCS